MIKLTAIGFLLGIIIDSTFQFSEDGLKESIKRGETVYATALRNKEKI